MLVEANKSKPLSKLIACYKMSVRAVSRKLTLRDKILWRALFWSGLFCMVIGFGFATVYLFSFSGVGLTFGLAFIVLAVALVTSGYFVLFKEKEP